MLYGSSAIWLRDLRMPHLNKKSTADRWLVRPGSKEAQAGREFAQRGMDESHRGEWPKGRGVGREDAGRAGWVWQRDCRRKREDRSQETEYRRQKLQAMRRYPPDFWILNSD